MTSSSAERTRKGKRRKSWTEQQSVFVFRLTCLVVGFILRFWIRHFRAVGVENIPASGGIFLIANHASGMDPFLVGYSIRHRMPRGPGKVELFENPFFGSIMRKIGMFPLRQDVADAAAVRTMVELYRNGRLVIIYPEGGRTKTGELQPFFPEFTRLMIKLKAPMIPAGIAGAASVLPIGSYIPQPNRRVAIAYGEPFDLSEFYGQPLTSDTLERATAVLQDRVADQLSLAERVRAAL
jgi:1-acyl-sn-glycerol-3-phosphate acyltransferase